MDENNAVDDLVLKYLDNELSDAEKRDFEAKLLTNAVLHSRLQKLKLARDAVQYHGIHQQVSEVRKLWEEKNTTAAVPVKARLVSMKKATLYSLAAASVIFAFIISRALFFTPYSSEKIYQDTFVGYQLGNQRSQGVSFNTLETAYMEKRYADVVAAARDSSLSAKDQLLLGIALLNLDNEHAAVPAFESMLNSPDQMYRQDAEFYLGLAYLKDKSYDKALRLMTKINNTPGHLYQKQVTSETLEKIKKLL